MSLIPTVLLAPQTAGVLRNYAALSVETDSTQIRNDLVGGQGTFPAIATETFTADGVTVLWTLQHVPDSTFVVPVVAVNGQVRTVGSAGSGSVSAEWGIVNLASGVSALMAGTDGVPLTGTTIIITYQYRAPVALRLQNTNSQTLWNALPSAGRIEHQPDTSAPTFAATAADLAGDLLLWAASITRARVTITQESAYTGLSEDQSIELVSGRLGLDLQMGISLLDEHGGQGSSGGRRISDLTLEA